MNGETLQDTRSGIHYRKARTFGNKVIVYGGKLGERGKVKKLDPRPGKTTRQVHTEQAAKPARAAALIAELRKHRLLMGAIIAVREKDEYRVVHPARFMGSFRCSDPVRVPARLRRGVRPATAW